MKVKTSVTLAEELVQEMDTLTDRYGNRSALVEQAVRTFLAAERQRVRDTRDLEILNRKAAKLNKEAREVLEYQVEL